jgi:hypothetical protein
MSMRGTSSSAAALFLLAACLGAPSGDGCACRTARERAPAKAAHPSGTALSDATKSSPEPSDPAPEPPAAALPDFEDPAWRRVPSRAGQYLVCWKPSLDPVPRNQDLELEVWILRDNAPVRGATLAVSGWMPDHGHGMMRGLRPEARADGSFRVEGVLFHMRGHWLLRFDVLEGALSESAECDLVL